LNDTIKVLESRRSCRSFKPDMIKDEELKTIIEAGTYAAKGAAPRKDDYVYYIS
jgi:nitroreductase